MNTHFFWRWCACLLLSSSVWGYDINLQNGQPITWNAGTVTMKLLLNTTPVLSDGSTYVSSMQTALQIWNSHIATVQFASETGLAVSPADNTTNEIAFDSTVYGKAFDDNVLAITVFYYFSNARPDGSYRRSEADVIFNSAYTWDSYRGPLRSAEDIQRIALHELGHVLGLDHPDEATPPQSVNAQMNSHVSNLDTLTADDVAGAQSLYGATNSAPSITVHPGNRSVFTAQSALFNIVATGTPAPTYQWQKKPNGATVWSNLPNSGNYSGNATAALSVTGAVLSMNGDQFRCVVTNSVGSAVSNSATLTVSPAVGSASVGLDFNGDGKSDLLWQNTGTGERSVWLMNGTALTAGVSLGLSPTQWSIAAVADFNTDGKPDLLWQNTLTGERTFWLMNGTTFVSSVDLGTYSTDLMIAGAGDFNGDGKPDLVWQNTSTGERSIWLMNGTTLGTVFDLGTFPPEWSIAGTGEFNGDGKSDLIWQNTVTGERAIWLMNGTTVTAGVALGVYPQLQISGTGDYNGDGKSDILWTNVSTGERIIWLMNGTMKASEVSLGVVSLDWVLNRPVFRRALADFNNDGKSDLVWQNTVTGDRAIWIMNGIEARTGLSLGNYAVDQWIAAVGDFNNDGKADLVWENRTTGVRSIVLMNGATALSTVALGVYDQVWKINTTGDFNADGKPDLVWTNSTTGARAIWLMDGTAFTAGVDLGTVAVAQQVAGTGDFDGDGKTDILWQNTTTGERTIWLMNGATHASTVTLGTYSPEWSIVGTGDYNADGKPDLLWQNINTGERAIWLMNGTTFLSSSTIGAYDTHWSIRN